MRRYWKVILAALTLTAPALGLAVYAAPGGLAPFAGQTGDQAPENSTAPAPVIDVAEATLPVSTLPGGASALSEAYQDWQVTCAMSGAIQRCVFSQNQTQGDGQRVLAIELGAPTANIINGLLVLPFGLALESGITLQIDDKPIGQPLRFRTCLPAGCVIDVRFDAVALTMLRAGAKLQVGATVDGGQAAPFAISLAGFAAALDRVAALSPRQ